MSSSDDRSLVLYCFSPFVILVTFLIETALAIYTIIRYRSTKLGKIAVVFFALLALYQLAELMMCQGGSADVWGRIALFATAFLPIMGIHFADILAGRTGSRTVIGYAIAAAFIAFIFTIPGLFTGAVCTGKLVIVYSASKPFELIYHLYYIAALFSGIGVVLQSLHRREGNTPALRWLLVGYLAFMVPTFITYFIAAQSREGIGSVLCGFALLMALIVAGKILPLTDREPRRRGTRIA